jgi:enoyl-CoA hydratase/carnithine racemase
MTPETRTVLTACIDGIATLTLNRPEVRNALDMAMRRELEEALTALAGDGQVRVLVTSARAETSSSCGTTP